jgi:DNA-binding ferritin-like protein
MELLAGIYEVIKPELLRTYHDHIRTTQQIVDQPTIRILNAIVSDLEQQMVWAAEMLAELRQEDNGQTDVTEFAGHIASYLAAAGGIDGEINKSAKLPSRWRSHQPYSLPLKSVRHPHKMGPTTLARTSVGFTIEDPVKKRVYDTMRIRQEEMTASELLASVMYAQKNMPWEFYNDLARHLWDEIRHAMFGQAALEAEGIDWMSRPQYTSDYDVNIHKIAGAQYAWLSIGIEEGAMKRPGKVEEYEFFLNQSNHKLMTQFQDYDYADEVVHANLGRKWSPELLGEHISFVREVAGNEMEHFWTEVKRAQEQYAADQLMDGKTAGKGE